jgi:hypothetical protein
LLEGEKIEAAMEEPPVIGELVFDILGQVPPSPQLVESYRVEVGKEVGILDLVEATTGSRHRRKVTGRLLPEWGRD